MSAEDYIAARAMRIERGEAIAKVFHEAYWDLRPTNSLPMRIPVETWEDSPKDYKDILINLFNHLIDNRVIATWSSYESQGDALKEIRETWKTLKGLIES